ncbi:MAG: hypothetical protein LBF37_01840 [Rickettsiales bacterium]|jgi:hypothetical protein|nr:hypothetical protein [Rickettsiales bacterium]
MNKNNIKVIPVKKRSQNNELWEDFLQGPIAVACANVDSHMPEESRIASVCRKYAEKYTFIALDEDNERQGMVLAHREFYRVIIDKLAVRPGKGRDAIANALLQAVETRAFSKNQKRDHEYIETNLIRIEPNRYTKAMLAKTGFELTNSREGNQRMEKKIAANGTFRVRRVTDKMQKAFEVIYAAQEGTQAYAKILPSSIQYNDAMVYVHFIDDQPVGLIAGNVDTVEIDGKEITQATLCDLYTLGKSVNIDKALMDSFVVGAQDQNATRIELIDVEQNLKEFEKFRRLGFVKQQDGIIKSL